MRITLGLEVKLFSRPLSVSTRKTRRDRYQFFMLSDTKKVHTSVTLCQKNWKLSKSLNKEWLNEKTLVDEPPIILLVEDQCRQREKLFVLTSKIHEHIIKQWLWVISQQFLDWESTLKIDS